MRRIQAADPRCPDLLSAVGHVCGFEGQDQLAKQPGKNLLLVLAHSREQGALDSILGAAILLERGVPGGGELDMHPAAVGLVGSPCDQASLLDRA
jgi:hypothetical protein